MNMGERNKSLLSGLPQFLYGWRITSVVRSNGVNLILWGANNLTIAWLMTA